MQEQTFTVAEVVQAIINSFEGDTKRVLAFYDQAIKLRGVSPAIDAIVEGLDQWLMPRTFNLTPGDLDDYVEFKL
jgi:hypothetical protein